MESFWMRSQRETRKQTKKLLDPFRKFGRDQRSDLKGILGGVETPGTAGQDFLTGSLALGGTPQDLTGLAGVSALAGAQGARDLRGEVSDIQGLDPNVLQSPFFQAQQAEATRNLEQSAAARGRLGSGGTKDAIARQSLLLGQQFGQQDLQNRLAAQGQRFGQLQNSLGFGLGTQAQGFGQIAGAQQQNFANQTGLNQQVFNQLSQAQQQEFLNQLGSQGQDFGQRFDILGLGQASAAGTAAGGQQSANQIANLQTGIGNAQAAGGIGAANAQAQGQQNALALGGAALSFFSDRRLKTNIRKIGTTPGGNNWYSYEYIWGEASEGVMADEVDHIPGAVIRHESGYDMVDYGRIT